MATSRDTTADADAVQLEVYRRMSSAQRTAIGNQMAIDARKTIVAGIRARHPEYDEAAARWGLFRLLYGDELFKRAWPNAPLIEP
ncbi:MAG TPA: hypothetical protein VGM90_14035 [Kofleriaceae bacterium]